MVDLPTRTCSRCHGFLYRGNVFFLGLRLCFGCFSGLDDHAIAAAVATECESARKQRDNDGAGDKQDDGCTAR